MSTGHLLHCADLIQLCLFKHGSWCPVVTAALRSVQIKSGGNGAGLYNYSIHDCHDANLNGLVTL